MKLRLPSDLSHAGFLETYWEKQPLLIRQAVTDLHFPIDASELAGLACNEQIESRLVLERDGIRPWEARHGPFDEAAFAGLPDSHWTLLVQDLDKHLPGFSPLLDAFRFIPDWRLDDIMVSYATDQGSVGPHVDDYDVFLLQVAGRRRWQIHTRPVSEDDYIPDLDLRILPDFEAEHDWILEPGDLLYLPPNVAHWGIAEGDDCMTCSVGFRAPGFQEMAAAWCQTLIDTQVPVGRYRDPELPLQTHPAEISGDTMARITGLLERFLRQDPEQQQRWFGRFITETKPHLQVLPQENRLDLDLFLQRWQSADILMRNPMSRFAFSQGQVDYLYVNGDAYTMEPGQRQLLRRITRERHFDYTSLQPLLTKGKDRELMCLLYNEGHCYFDDE